MNLAQRTITSVSWNVVANLAKIGVLFVRSILLARLLPVETFGVYALATSLVTFTLILPEFGLGGAFLHRSAETADEDAAAANHLALNSLLTLLWTLVMVAIVVVVTSGALRLALLVLTFCYAGLQLARTPQLILIRRVQHRRLALIDLSNALLTTAVALLLAWRGETLVALLATDVATLLVTAVGLYLWRPVWRPRLAWSPEVIRYYRRFGWRGLAANVLNEALDNIDDIWTGAYLGTTWLGFYSRAFTFATYPRRVLAFPVSTVAGGTYAELKERRLQLSQVFFRINALLVRSGFLFGGLLALIAPEFIHLLLGDKWLPMLTTFQLMLVFTLLDPLKATISSLFIAVGRPEQVIYSRLVQLVVMVAGLFLFGYFWGIVGVALAVDIMLLVGMGWLLRQARAFVDYSLRRLFLAPAVALALALLAASGLAYLVRWRPEMVDPAFITGIIKLVTFLGVYVGMLLLLERRALLAIFLQFSQVWKSPNAG